MFINSDSQFAQSDSYPSGMMVPLRCRAGPQQGCFQEASSFLSKFKEKLSQSANEYFSKRNPQQARQDMDLERNFRELQQIDFKLQVG